jgi:hypothetical protein
MLLYDKNRERLQDWLECESLLQGRITPAHCLGVDLSGKLPVYCYTVDIWKKRKPGAVDCLPGFCALNKIHKLIGR